MDASFSVHVLDDETQIDRLFPLANLTAGVSLDRWRSFALASLRSGCPGSGILVVADESGYVLALCCLDRREDLALGPVLAVENLMLIELVNSRRVLDLLLQKIEAIAHERRVVAVRVSAVERAANGSLARTLAESGYRPAMTQWVKPVGAQPVVARERQLLQLH